MSRESFEGPPCCPTRDPKAIDRLLASRPCLRRFPAPDRLLAEEVQVARLKKETSLRLSEGTQEAQEETEVHRPSLLPLLLLLLRLPQLLPQLPRLLPCPSARGAAQEVAGPWAALNRRAACPRWAEEELLAGNPTQLPGLALLEEDPLPFLLLVQLHLLLLPLLSLQPPSPLLQHFSLLPPSSLLRL